MHQSASFCRNKVMIHAREQDLRKSRLCSKNIILKITSFVSRLAIKPLALSTHTQIQRTKGSLLPAALPGDGTTSSMSPRIFQEKPASLDLECWFIRSCFTCRMSGGMAVPPVHPKSMEPERSWKTEELCFSQEKGWPTAPQTSPHCP